MDYKNLSLRIVLFAFLISFSVFSYKSVLASSLKMETDEFVIINSDGEKLRFKFEIADTDVKRQKGLSGRESLEENEGMIFISKPSKVFAMWMKDTLIPLDMLFVDYSGEIQHIEWEAEPHSEEIKTYFIPVRAVIEVRGGLTIDKNINPGDKVLHPMFYNPRVSSAP